MSSEKVYTSFKDFYPFYLSQHANRTSRRLHVIGTSLGTTMLITAAVTMQPHLVLYALLCGYGFAWVGHFFFEKNKPATFKYPFYSLRGDYVMLKDIATGKIPF
jgi:hypothetical protein